MAGGVTVELKGVEELKSHISRIANAAKLKRAVVEGTSMMLSTAKMRAVPGKFGSGALRNSIHMKVDEQRDQISGKIFTALEYAMYVEFGTGIIGENSNYPRAGQLGLSYAHYPWTYTPDNGERFFRTEGQPARPSCIRRLLRTNPKSNNVSLTR